MKKTILNALWAKIKDTFIQKNSAASLNSLSTSGIYISGSGSGSGGVFISGDNYHLDVNNTVINSSGINVKSGAIILDNGGIKLGTGKTLMYSNGNVCLSDNKYLNVDYVMATSGTSYFNSIVASSVNVKFDAVNISGSGISLGSGIGIWGSGFLLSGYGLSTSGFTCSGGGASFSNGIILYSGSINLNGSSGNIKFNSTYQKIQGYTGTTGSGMTTMSNVVIDSSNDIEFLKFQKINYLDLLSLKESNQLIKGKSYIIMDYETFINEQKDYLDVDATYNKFNVIVTAENAGQLSEDAILYVPSNPNLFPGVEYETFLNYIMKIKVKYCIDNDITRFDWADRNGKGVIYRMIDQYGNDMPFDFIHMKFKRYIYNRSDSSLKSQKWTPDIPSLPVGLPRIQNCLPKEFSNGVNSYLENFAGGTVWSDLENEVFCMHTSDSLLYVFQNPDGINLLVPNRYLKAYESVDNYLHNEHPANNIISPRYVTTIIDNIEYRTMSIPNITVLLDSADNYVKISNNYFGPNADEIAIFGSRIENNKFDGSINNVFFAGHKTINVNITKNAHIENTILMSLENVDIGGYLYNTWFCHPILNGSINGEIYNSLIFFDGDDSASVLNIEKNVRIEYSILKLPNISDGTSITLRELYISNSAVGYDSKDEIGYFNVKLLDGSIKNKAFNFGGVLILQDNQNFIYLHAFTTDIYIMNSIGNEMSQSIKQADYWNS